MSKVIQQQQKKLKYSYLLYLNKIVQKYYKLSTVF